MWISSNWLFTAEGTYSFSWFSPDRRYEKEAGSKTLTWEKYLSQSPSDLLFAGEKSTRVSKSFSGAIHVTKHFPLPLDAFFPLIRVLCFVLTVLAQFQLVAPAMKYYDAITKFFLEKLPADTFPVKIGFFRLFLSRFADRKIFLFSRPSHSRLQSWTTRKTTLQSQCLRFRSRTRMSLPKPLHSLMTVERSSFV